MIKEITLIDFIKHPKLFWGRSLTYFTNWVLLLLLLSKWTNAYFDLHTLVLFITLASTFIVFVYPKMYLFYAHSKLFVITGAGAHLLNVVFHIIPMVLVFLFVPRRSDPNMLRQLNSFVLLFIYITLQNPEKVYALKSDIIVLFYILSFLLVKSLYKEKILSQ